MLNRLTVSALLKTVILTTAFCVVVGFSLNAWDSWGRLQAASRIAVIADASAEHVQGDAQSAHRPLHHQPAAEWRLRRWTAISRNTCAAFATPKCRRWATRSGCSATIEFAQQATLVPEFDRLFKTLTAQQKEFWEAMAKPKAHAPRRAGQGIYGDDAGRCSTTLDKLSGTLAATVNHQDAVIDQLLAIKQIAWLLRNTAGEASLLDLERAWRRQGRAGNARSPIPNSSAAPKPRGMRWN